MRRVGSFKVQLFVGFAAVVGSMVVASVITFTLERRAASEHERMLEAISRAQLAAVRIELDTERLVSASRGYLLTTDASTLEHLEVAEAHIERATNELLRTRNAAELSAQLVELKAAVSGYLSAFRRLESQSRTTENREAFSALVESELLPRRAELRERVERLIGYTDRLLDEERALARADVAAQVRALAGAGVGGVALSLLLAWWIVRRLDAVYEAERTAKSRAERAVQSREDLLAIVAHDLRNPLNALSLRATSLLRHKDESARRSAEGLVTIISRMDRLIGSLLEAAVIEAGKLALARARCSVAELIHGTTAVFGGLAAAKRIRLTEDIEEGQVAVAADRERLLQVLSNLVGNALKFTPEGGEIRIRVVSAIGAARFEVKDSGPGLSTQQLPHVFDRYWKSDQGGHTGVGLGLYIAKGIVEAHGGRIWVESPTTEGRGCLFAFEIPLAPPTMPEAAPAVRPELPQGPRA